MIELEFELGLINIKYVNIISLFWYEESIDKDSLSLPKFACPLLITIIFNNK